MVRNGLKYEMAYIQYRLNDVEEAIATLDSIKEPDFRVKELKAQAVSRIRM